VSIARPYSIRLSSAVRPGGFAHPGVQARQGVLRHHDMDWIAVRARQRGGALQTLQGARQIAFFGIRFT
jgi:hypothetical protein